MPLTLADLQLWEQEKDIDKFAQILKFLREDQFADVRILTVKALSRLRDLDGLRLLIQSTDDNNEAVASCAYNELIAWANEDLEPICAIVEDNNEADKVRYLGLRFISEIPKVRVIDTYFLLLKRGHWVDSIRGFVKEMDNIEPFVSKLQDADPALRYSAILALGEIFGNPQIILEFIKALGDENVQVRSIAAFSISNEVYKLKQKGEETFDVKRYKSAIHPLIENLKDEDFLVRANSAEALGDIQDPRSVKPLISLLADPFERVRINAILSLAQIPNKRAYRDLSRLYVREESIDVRKAIIRAIKTSLHSDALSFLESVVENENEFELRKRAIKAIGSKRTDESRALLLKILDSGNIVDINIVLGALESSPDLFFLDRLLILLEQDNEKIDFWSLTRAIAHLNQKSALVPLFRILGKDSHREDSQWIVRSIREILQLESIGEYLASLDVSNDEFLRIGVLKFRALFEVAKT